MWDYTVLPATRHMCGFIVHMCGFCVHMCGFCVHMCLAVENTVSTAAATKHLQRVHSADCSAAVRCSLFIAGLSQTSVGTALTTKVPDLLTTNVHISVAP